MEFSQQKRQNVKFNKIMLVAAAAGLCAASQAMAVDVRPHYKVGFDGGGDKLATVVFTDGTHENIKANAGIFFGGGMSIVNDSKSVEGELAITYKVDDITASNGDVTWSRWPIDALAFYRWNKVRLGGGLTYHINPKLSGSGVASGINLTFKDSLGYLLQADWRITEKMNLGARYTMLDYGLSGSTTSKVHSNGLGIVFSGSF